MQRSGLSGEAAEEAKSSLEKSVQLNPQFAPVYEGLSQAYSRSPETQKQAVNAAIKAAQLDPGQLSYAINLAYLLLNSSRFAEARIMAQRILAAAVSPGEKEVASNLLQHVQQAEEWAAKRQPDSSALPVQSDKDSIEFTTSIRPAGTTGQEGTQDASVQLRRRLYGADGRISMVECSKKPEFTIDVDLPNGPVSFHATDFGKVSMSWADSVPEPSLKTCEQWKGRQVKVWFLPTPGKEYAGEISKLYFF